MSYANFRDHKLPGVITYLEDLLRYRHLCANLVGSDLRSRFRRSHLGMFWAVLQPLGYSLVIAWVWGTLFKTESYWTFAVYVYAGMLVWEYFTNTVMTSLDGLINSIGYLRQSRIPFFIFQVRVPLTGAVMFCAGLAGLVALMAVVQQFPAPGLHLLLIPVYVAVLIAFMVPIAIMASLLGAKLRDLKHIMMLALQAMFFLTPVMMTRDYMDSEHLALLKYLNPLVSLIDMFRDPMLYGQLWERQDVIIVSAWGAAFWTLALIVAVGSGRRVVFAL